MGMCVGMGMGVGVGVGVCGRGCWCECGCMQVWWLIAQFLPWWMTGAG